MANIVFTRVDNRLVHGQVGCTWTSSLGANLLVVADDVVANDSLQQDLMGITAQSSGVGIRFFSIDKTIEIINKASAKQKIFLVVRDLQSACRLVKGGVPIAKLNLGNLHFSEGKRKLSSKVYVDDNDMAYIEEIKQLNVEVFIQDVPQDDIKKL
ncbi:MAG: PTS galactosamine transporter subunit IIB [Erysipelotrichaceae bacterium]